jgi:Ca2+-binding RTX toxin-like protein
LSEFKVLGQVAVTSGGFDFDDFWQPGILLNIPPTVTTAYSASGPLVFSDEAGSIAHGGVTVPQSVTIINSPTLVGPAAPLNEVQTGVFSVTDSQGGTGTDTNNTVFTLGTDSGETISGQYVWGFGGNDTITGTSGNDVLSGVAGDDVINAGGGADTIYAGPGADTVNLTVDNAADVIFLSASAADVLVNGDTASSVSVPTVFDFSTAQDTIVLTDFPGSNKQIIIGSTNLGANPYDKAALIGTFSLDNQSYEFIKAGVLGTDGIDTYLYYWDDAGSGSLTSADTLSLMAIFKGVTDLTAMNNALDIL